MPIVTRDDLFNANMNNNSRVMIDKASMSNAAATQFHSLWRATGQPGQGAIPTSAAVCDNALTGAMNFTQQTDPATSYLTLLEGSSSNSLATIEIHDRLMHMGGLSGTVTTGQTINLDVHANLATANLAARIGDDNYSDIQWWAEWYTDTGGTGVNLTVDVTYGDGTSASLTAVALAATRRASFMIPLNSLIPGSAAGKFIRDLNTGALSATTGTAGNFGFTATRLRGSLFMPIANCKFDKDALRLGPAEIPNESCLFPIVMPGAATTGTIRAQGLLAHG